MVIIIDNDTDALQYDQLTQLEGFEYLLSFFWSDVEGAWYMTVSDQNANLLAAGIKLVCNVDLLSSFTNTALPPGVFIVNNLTNVDSDMMQPSDIRNNYPLCYITSDDAVNP